MPKVSFTSITGTKYLEDFYFNSSYNLRTKLIDIYNQLINLDNLIAMRMILNNIELNKYIIYNLNIEIDITITLIKINLLDNIEDTLSNRNRIKKLLNLEYSDTHIIRNINKFKDILANDTLIKLLLENYHIFLQVKYIDDKFRDDENIMFTCINYGEKDASLFNILSDRLQNDKNLVIKLIDRNPYIYKYLNIELKKDEKIIYEALKYAENFNFLPNNLINNEEFILNLIKLKFNIFKFIPINLKCNKRILLSCISNKLIDHKYFDIEFNDYNYYYKFNDAKMLLNFIKKDREIILEFIKNDNHFYYQLIKEIENSKEDIDKYKNDLEIIEKVIENYPNYIGDVSNLIKNNRNIIYNLIKINSKIFNNNDINKMYGNDKEIILEVIKNNPLLLEYASKEIKQNNEIKKIALDVYLDQQYNNFNQIINSEKKSGLFS